MRPDDDFAMSWEVDGKSEKHIKEIAAGGQGRRPALSRHRPRPRGRGDLLACAGGAEAAQGARRASTSSASSSTRSPSTAVLDAFRHPREIDRELVDAYLARRALDYLVGFTLSPVLWRKLPGSRSAGRVQSVALRLDLRARGRDRGLQARANTGRSRPSSPTAAGERFTARLTQLDGKRLDKIRPRQRGEGPRRRRRDPAPAELHASPRSRRSRSAATRRRPSPPRPCSRKPRASSASAPAAPCASPSGSTRASISAARRSASSPICAPTASPSSPRRSPRRAS